MILIKCNQCEGFFCVHTLGHVIEYGIRAPSGSCINTREILTFSLQLFTGLLINENFTNLTLTMTLGEKNIPHGIFPSK